MFNPPPFVGAVSLSFHVVLVCVSLTLPVHAQQAPAPAQSASAPTGMERSQRQADNVYRFIKLFADKPPKATADPTKVKPKSDTAAQAPRRPDAQAVAAPASTEPAPAEGAPVAASSLVATEAAAPTQSASAARADTQVEATAAVVAQAPAVEEPEELTLVQQVEPEFPRELRNTVSQGKVLLAFTVQPDGSVSGTSIVSASNRRLGKPAMEAVSKWRFTPIRTARTAQVEIEFNQQ